MSAARHPLRKRHSTHERSQYLASAVTTYQQGEAIRLTRWTLVDTPPDTEQFEVIVPVSTRFRDYAQRINDVIRIVAEAEARPEPEIIRSAADPYIDRQYFRLRYAPRVV
jgi:hypothetical protein